MAWLRILRTRQNLLMIFVCREQWIICGANDANFNHRLLETKTDLSFCEIGKIKYIKFTIWPVVYQWHFCNSFCWDKDYNKEWSLQQFDEEDRDAVLDIGWNFLHFISNLSHTGYRLHYLVAPAIWMFFMVSLCVWLLNF